MIFNPLYIMFLLILLLVAYTGAVKLPEKAKDHDFEDLDFIQNLYKDYLEEHGKVYTPEEIVKRLEYFKKSLIDINERNAKYPEVEYGLDRFSDLTEAEKVQYFGALPLNKELESLNKLEYRAEAVTAPEHWDWREHGAVTDVKDQGGTCGSCWTFSAIGNIEGQYAIKYNETISFSAQQCLDCVEAMYLDNNCWGGYPHRCMLHFLRSSTESFDRSVRPVVTEKSYPYIGRQGPCKDRQTDFKLMTTVDSVKVLKTDEESLKQLLYETGPLSTLLDMADLPGYKKGILHPHKCTEFLNHAVLIVGYGIENGTKYWIAKNSFGTSWGENGYFRLVRGVSACDFGTRYVATATVGGKPWQSDHEDEN